MKLNEKQKQYLLDRFNESLANDGDAEDILEIVKEFLSDIETPFNIKPVSQEDVDKAIAKAKGGTKKFLQSIIDKLD